MDGSDSVARYLGNKQSTTPFIAGWGTFGFVVPEDAVLYFKVSATTYQKVSASMGHVVLNDRVKDFQCSTSTSDEVAVIKD